MAETKEKTSAAAEQTPKKSGLKRLFQSRKMRHGSLAVVFTAIAVAVVILLNVVAGLLVDRFPEMKADFTANKAFALANDTKEYMSRLDKDVKLYIISDEDDFMNTSTYFVQAKNLLDKMVSSSNGKFTYEFVNTTDNPKFTQQYPNINWQTKDTVGVLTCGEQYKGLGVKDCFTYDEDYYNYYGSYSWTGTTIEQAVVKGTLDVTTEEKVVVDILTGEGETDTNGYEGLKALMTDNAYQVNEVSLLTGEPDKDARVMLLFAPLTDLSDTSAETVRKWLENDGKGVVYDTDLNHNLNNAPFYTFIVDYTDYYKENLKNSTVPVLNEYATGITIKDTNTAHALLQTTDKAGILPLDAKEDFDFAANVTGETIAIAAEGQKAGTEAYSNVVVFSSKAMLLSGELSYASFNNAAYFMNMLNTITEKEDNTVVIEGKSLENATLGAPGAETSNAVMIVFMIVLPALILILGIVLWIRRRNR